MKTLTISNRFWKESLIEKFPTKFSSSDLVQIKTEIYSLHHKRHRFHICKLTIDKENDYWDDVIVSNYPGVLVYYEDRIKGITRMRQYYFYGTRGLDLSPIKDNSKIIIKKANLSQLFSFNLWRNEGTK